MSGISMSQLAFHLNQAGSNDQKKYPPMLQQYLDYKEKLPDCLLFFQVGDFYELFFEDAVLVSKLLNLTLTSRDKNATDPVPMCGVPIHAIEGYLERLVDAGHSVALVSQISQTVDSKVGVERRLERIVTPALRAAGGMSASSNVSRALVACYGVSDTFCLVSALPESGQLEVQDGVELGQVPEELSKFQPAELVLPKLLNGAALDRRTSFVREIQSRNPKLKIRFRALPSAAIGRENNRYQSMKGFERCSNTARSTIRLWIDYVDEIMLERELQISLVRPVQSKDSLQIDSMTSTNLELLTVQRPGGDRRSLYDYLNRCQFVGGIRLLRNWIQKPLSNKEHIENRLAVVKFFREDGHLLKWWRDFLSQLVDLERIASRIEIGFATPPELAQVREFLRNFPEAVEKRDSCDPLRSYIAEESVQLEATDPLLQKLEQALVEDPSSSFVEGEILRAEYDPELNRLRSLARSGSQWVVDLEQRERQRSGIQSLKIKYNSVLGYFFEATKANLSKIPEDFVSRQSLRNVERFTTRELKDKEQEILRAKSKLEQHERFLYEEFRDSLREYTHTIRAAHRELSIIDVLSTFSDLCQRENLVLPQFVEDQRFHLDQGRHPILAELLEGSFVPNSWFAGGGMPRTFLLTGPNMGGKSTYLRQIGLVAVMAHVGCGVPAKRLELSACDQIFARLGANDDMFEGQSTFMVEMKEAANILCNASSKSLVLIDEIGRGTATSDGEALAESILFYLIDSVQCLTLFATHFYSLTRFSSEREGLQNICVGACFNDQGIVFTHQIEQGSANGSYGLEVAKMAKLPSAVTQQAWQIIRNKKSPNWHDGGNEAERLNLETTMRDLPAHSLDQPVFVKKIKELVLPLKVDEMRPIDALVELERIQKIIKEQETDQS